MTHAFGVTQTMSLLHSVFAPQLPRTLFPKRKYLSSTGVSAQFHRAPSRSRMHVPLASSLNPGVGVNIILKADQPTGKLTYGRVAERLTRGDHPRGVKVRLQDGRVGRVQSLATRPALGNVEKQTTAIYAVPANQFVSEDTGNDFHSSGQGSRDVGQDGSTRDDGDAPPDVRSLADYATIKPSRQKPKSEATAEQLQVHEDAVVSDAERDPADVTLQAFEHEFPELDSALIAAILSDGQSIDEARSVLLALASESQDQ